MVVYNSDQLVPCAHESAWDEDPSIVIDFDEDDLFSFSGHDSFMSFCENDCDPALRCKSAFVHCTNINDSMKQDDRRVHFMAKNTSVLYKHDGDSLKPQHVVGRPIPLVDMLGEIFSVRAMELQQQHENLNTDTERALPKMTLDEQLKIAQKKLEDSIRRSQVTRPKFIQFSESMMRSEAYHNLVVSLKSNNLLG